LRVSILISSDDELVKIDSLECYPLRFAPAELKAKLEKKGEKFWGIQYRNLWNIRTRMKALSIR
jgi:hypothetical protein